MVGLAGAEWGIHLIEGIWAGTEDKPTENHAI
jgi:hypothetical protein